MVLLKYTAFYMLFLTFLTRTEAICFPSMEKFECIANKAHCKNLACNYTLINPFMINLTNVGCTLTRSHRKVKLRMRHEIKTAINRYKPGLYDTTVDFCDIFTGFSAPLMSILFPNAIERLGSAFHACPYNPSPVYVHNMMADAKTVPSMGQIGEYKLSYTFTSGKFLDVAQFNFYGQRCVLDDVVNSNDVTSGKNESTGKTLVLYHRRNARSF